MGYPSGNASEFGEFKTLILSFKRRLDELERPTGSQTAQALKTLQDLVDGLLTQVNGVFSGYVTAGSYITAQGIVTGVAGVNSVGVYNTLVSGSPYKVQYVMNDGTMGYVPSSRRYKQDIKTAELDVRAVMRQLRVVTFRYIEAASLHGDAAAVEWGLIAEEVHALGLTWLVDYNESGEPDGLKHERWAVLLILDAQNKQMQIDSLADRISALEP